MTDTFSKFQPGLQSPICHVVNVVPNDAVDASHVSRALNVATTGNVRVTTLGGEIATVHIVAGGAFPIRVVRVWATGTTATGIAVMY